MRLAGVEGAVVPRASTSEAQLPAVWVIFGEYRWVTSGARRRRPDGLYKVGECEEQEGKRPHVSLRR